MNLIPGLLNEVMALEFEPLYWASDNKKSCYFCDSFAKVHGFYEDGNGKQISISLCSDCLSNNSETPSVYCYIFDKTTCERLSQKQKLPRKMTLKHN